MGRTGLYSIASSKKDFVYLGNVVHLILDTVIGHSYSAS